MNVNAVELTNFRNYCSERIYFDHKINVISGKNAQGKTNLLEAVYFCSIGKSLKTTRENELIKFDNDKAKILLNFSNRFGEKNINIFFEKSQKKAISINSLFIHRLGDLVGEFPCVFFSPDELKLVKDTPQDRRRFMDIDISQFSKEYFNTLVKYNKVLLQRNKLLKSFDSEENIKKTIFIWNKQLANLGATIISRRMEFLDLLSPFASEMQKRLTDNSEQLSLQYYSEDFENYDSIEQELLAKLEQNFDKDYKLKFTTIGPHRDDIKLVVNGKDIRSFGSQGQQRTVALCLKLAETEVLKFSFGEYPVLLLDDVMSELDSTRQKNLLKIVSSMQTFITSTEPIYDDEFEINNIVIENGLVKK